MDCKNCNYLGENIGENMHGTVSAYYCKHHRIGLSKNMNGTWTMLPHPPLPHEMCEEFIDKEGARIEEKSW